ncbi:hypothetical protein HBF26_09965 [Luteibacter jiangsuensis]|uniref:4-amino-4-deoxy-L-arabinose transferase-like glycosyltransferase n=1 Tax=Luteibacter jiangsuensis TaxID=637577 RepID=A0ABX0Q498_9GAMM|nr:hypothetical protein [Luteibacter jiangsuensis]NID05212.1 hypothetical protein [Luteibacter jiangsuensis]
MHPGLWVAIALLVTFIAYAPGLKGAWLFDDFPNIVDNADLHIKHLSLPELTSAALSSPSSDFKRPLASLSFALNIYASGVDPEAMKLTNVIIHLINGLLVFLLARRLIARDVLPDERDSRTAALVAAAWLLLPINLTAVLYVVQRMESLANVFVLLGLYGYVVGRQRMERARYGFALSALSLVLGTGLGLLAKETAVLTPLYAFLIEWLVFRDKAPERRLPRRIWILFGVVLFMPGILGVAWIAPALFRASTWATRDFTMTTRLLSEARVVLDYLAWTVVPTPSALSFYHDEFRISTGLLSPPITLLSIVGLVALAGLAFAARRRAPLLSLGIAWFLAAQTLTATIVPLELIYEHRNYFASFGVVLAVVTTLRRQSAAAEPRSSTASSVALGLALVYWGLLTAYSAYRWGNPVRLAQELAIRAPDSPRAQYELGRTYIIVSGYKADSPVVPLVAAPLEKAAALPGSSTLPEQALIYFAARMHRPIKQEWWDSMERKLKLRSPTIEDESAIMSLSSCSLKEQCALPADQLLRLYMAALNHPRPRGRLLSAYGDFAWNGLGDRALGFRMAQAASAAEPSEPAYHITIVKEALVLGNEAAVAEHMAALRRLNLNGRLDDSIKSLQDRAATYGSSAAKAST